MADSVFTKTSKAQPPTPPRLTGDAESNSAAILQWMSQFYNTTVRETGLLDPAYQATPGTFDPASLPDPAKTTIAAAQQTANEAYKLAAQVASAILSFPLLPSSITISDTDNAADITFADPLDDENYMPVIQATGYTGSPAADAFLVIATTRTKEGFQFVLNSAPGSGASVTFDYWIVRK